MAKKKQDLSDIFAKTEPAPGATAEYSDLDAGKIQSTGVGLKQGEIAALDAIAADLEITRNAIMRFAIRYFIIQHRAGNIDLASHVEEPPPPKKSLRLPGQE